MELLRATRPVVDEKRVEDPNLYRPSVGAAERDLDALVLVRTVEVR